ncbi:hypothetical protein [Streptomyces niveus]|uniref:hypothetical protein n=1 Tax=Streptomyces niveus TaxID=193462 RepID=UPI00342B1773
MELGRLRCTASHFPWLTADAGRAAEFDREIEHVPAAELPAALVRCALAGTGADDEDEVLFERLARGEDIGATPGSEAG